VISKNAREERAKGRGSDDFRENAFGRLNVTVDATIPELRAESQYTQETTSSVVAHNSSLIDQRQLRCPVLPAYTGGALYSAPHDPQLQASRRHQRHAEPRSSPLRAVLLVPNTGLHLHHNTGCMRYWPCATWRVRCECVRHQTCLHCETDPPASNESKTAPRASRKRTRSRELSQNGELLSLFRPWYDICCQEYDEVCGPGILHLSLGIDR